MDKVLKILGIVGSLRKDSYNKALMHAASELTPKNVILEVFDLDGIPPFNQDLENDPPQSVKEFKAKIKAADALLIATPEYNYSFSGVLKNAIDWASRPLSDKVFEGKTVAVMSASTERFGGARAQDDLRQCFVFLNMHPVNQPEIFLTSAPQSIDEKGKIINKMTRLQIRNLLEELVRWTRKLAQAAAEI